MKVVFREEWLEQYVAGQAVLDLGSLDHNLREEKGSRWLYARLKKTARSIFGLDLTSSLEDNIFSGDVENLKHFTGFGYKMIFDVIVAGEIIEHLARPSEMLQGLKKYMDITTLIITTPNAYSFRRIWDSLIINRERIRFDHTHFHSVSTLTRLLEMNGYKIKEKLVYVYKSRHKRSVWMSYVIKWLLGWRPMLADGLIFKCEKIN